MTEENTNMNADESNNEGNEMAEGSDIISIAQKGIQTNSRIKELKKELKAAKEELRSYAEMISGSSRETVEIETPDGNVQVSFSPDRVKVKSKDTDTVIQIRDNEVLSDVQFKAIFEEVTSFKVKNDYEKSLSALTDVQREKVEETISVTSPSPAVKFPNV